MELDDSMIDCNLGHAKIRQAQATARLARKGKV